VSLPAVAFPRPRAVPESLARAVAGRGLELRWARDADRPALMALYATTRADELAGQPWPESTKSQFVAQQYELQHRHFVERFPAAEFLVVQRADVVVGRLYLDRSPQAARDLVVDICLAPEWRGEGIGGALLRAAQTDAAARGRGVELHVLAWNAGARRLYERLGFVVVDATSPHVLMHWAPPAALS
jgi:ribosomal protein S18 acetylase RimI-like enzyme